MTGSDVAVRRARQSDLDDLVRLVRLAHDEVRGQRGGVQWLATEADREPLADAIGSVLGDGSSPADLGDGSSPADHGDGSLPADHGEAWLLADLGDVRAVGCAHVSIRSRPETGGVAAVRLLFVESEARELGVGEALLDSAIELARRHGCDAVESIALPGDRALKNLFERFGIVARAIVVERAL